MTNALASLQALATKQYKPRNQSKLAQKIEKIVRPEIKTIEIDTDMKEIRVNFMTSPGNTVANELFAHGFKWQIASNIYVNDYDNEVIEYLNREWGQSIDLIQSPEKIAIDSQFQALDSDPSAKTSDYKELYAKVEALQVHTEESMLDRYKRQVDELCESLKIDKVELLFLAIEHLHTSKLSQ